MPYIYRLIDPNTREVRYIGKSIDPRHRLKLHMSRCLKGSSYRQRWLSTLKRNGQKPILEIVESVTDDNWAEREQHWIRHYWAIGAPLTNTTIGGDGVKGIPEHLEKIRREKVSSSRKGMSFTEGHKAALSEAKKKYFAKEENTFNLSRHWASLTDEQVLEVFEKADRGELTQSEIAKQYKIPPSTVSNILSGKRYKHVKRRRPTNKRQAASKRKDRFAKRVSDFYLKGAGYDEICKKFDISKDRAYRLIKHCLGDVPTPAQRDVALKDSRISKEYESGVSINDIAKAESMSTDGIRKSLIRQGKWRKTGKIKSK